MKKLKFIIGGVFMSIMPIAMILITLVRNYGEKLAVYPQVKENYGIIMVILFLGALLENFIVIEELEEQ